MTIGVEQKLAIHELLSRAAYAYDEREVSMLEECFHPDASFSMRIAGGDLIGPFEGREAIMGLFNSSMEEQSDVRRHIISNIFFDDGSAEIKVISNLTLVATEKGAIQLLSAGVYRDTVAEQSGAWRLVRRHLDLDNSY